METFHEETQFRIEPPHGKRKGYRIRYKSPDTGNLWKTYLSEEVKLANEAMFQGTSPELTEEKLKVIRKRLYEVRDATKKKAAFMAGNLEIVARLWETRYPARRIRKLKRPNDIRAEYERAARAAGLHPLDTCDLGDLADYLDKTLADQPAIHSRRVAWINSILAFLGRPQLEPIRDRGRPEVNFLTEEDMLAILPHIRFERTRLLVQIAFYTGLRLGEIFFLQARHLRPDHIYVEKQMLDTVDPDTGRLKIDTTKPGHPRKALLVDAALPALKKWVETPLIDREALRVLAYAKVVHRACRKVFPGDPIKDCCFHDLRHSNAIWLLSQGASIHEVAQHLGNLLEVTERYYSGFVLKEGSITRLKGLIDKGV